jgi:flagellar FliL protein
MSKKARKTEEDGAPSEDPPKSRKKLLVIAGAVLLAAAGAGGWFAMRSPPPDQIAAADAAAKAKKPVTFLDMKDMMIGISNGGQQDRQPIMKIKVALEIADPKTAEEVKPLLPRVEDAFQVFMRELRPSDLEGSAGMYRLKEELLRRVNVTVHPAKVDAVLFKELLIQ